MVWQVFHVRKKQVSQQALSVKLSQTTMQSLIVTTKAREELCLPPTPTVHSSMICNHTTTSCLDTSPQLLEFGQNMTVRG